ncbi:hypothetical protein BKA82DRAFT_1000450 [Pisolithus tinctorius]|uniref:Uncharacterized protein n=1 Tax=Pisolithus tinctorius Marx 270 TaxID=870435 RepID=A0A0C3K4S0_PISTI|nr:hypothetical protein BKA82DRAFT_1000450 [Pisolithus tinctorius]KIO04577.1 hypothetical protein M404DRAFT_1000450 [Pisolithus tinctorius Marx 270]
MARSTGPKKGLSTSHARVVVLISVVIDKLCTRRCGVLGYSCNSDRGLHEVRSQVPGAGIMIRMDCGASSMRHPC